MLELKVAMISNDFEGLRQAFKIYMPILKCFCDSKHLTVIDFIVALSFVYKLRPICNEMLVSVFTLLVDNTICGKSKSINFYLNKSFKCPNGYD
jgi:hypothetical protein